MAEVIWVVPKSPLPAFDGARIATAALLSGLSDLGVSVHLVVINSEKQPEAISSIQDELGLSSVTFVDTAGSKLGCLPSRLQSLLLTVRRPYLGMTLQRYASPALLDVVSELAQKTASSLLVFDGLHTAAAYCTIAGLFNGVDLPVVYRAHNREFRIWQRKASVVRNPLARLFFSVQAALVGRFENSLVQGSVCTCTVSQEDIEDFQQDCATENYLTVPIGDDFSALPTPVTNTTRLFFVGRLDWQPNVEGLRWFLEEVWPEAKKQRPSLELEIVGSGNGAWLQSYASLDGVKILGRVDSLEPYYENAALCLIPIFFGSGTRVKAIEASRYGRPCVSTAVGVEGLPLSTTRDYFNGETSQEWIQLLVNLDIEDLNERGRNAYATLAPLYDRRASARIFWEQFFGSERESGMHAEVGL